jgi:NADH-quinone oxidoreductase subunit N
LVDHAYWGALTCAVIGAAAGFYYYFKTILAMYSSDSGTAGSLSLSIYSKTGAVVLALIIVVLGVFPRPLQSMLNEGSVPVQAK